MLVPNPLMTFHKDSLCLCGSGKKFKLCHRPRLPRMVTKELADESAAVMKKAKRARAKGEF